MATDDQTTPPNPLRRLGFAGSLLDVAGTRWEAGDSAPFHDQVVEETPVAIVYNRVPHVVMMATPDHLEDFVLGFSITEELIRSPADLLSISIERFSQGIEVQVSVAAACDAVIGARSRKLSGRTGCGICGADSIAAVLKTVHPVPAGTPVEPGIIELALANLADHQHLNRSAGAVHAAGWADQAGRIVLAREDVGRHNALDKLVGACLAAEVDLGSGFVVVTSRASFEMVQKATVLGAPLLAAISGPTGLAVRLADAAGLTLVGFARKGRLAVYTHPQRVVAKA